MLDEDGKAIVAFATLGKTPDGATAEVQYGIVTKDNGTTKIDGTAYTTYLFWNGEEEITINLKADAGSLEKGDVYAFVRSKDDTYSSISGFEKLTGVKTLGSDKEITLEGTKYQVTPAFAKEYNREDGIITFGTAVTADKDGVYSISGDAKTLAVDKDVKVVYVNTDSNAAGADMGGDVDAFNNMSGKANVMLVKDSAGKVVKAMIVETSGKTNIFD